MVHLRRRDAPRPIERAPVKRRDFPVAPTVTAFAMVAQQVAGKAIRDGFFLETHAASELPKVMIAASALGIAFVLATSWLLAFLSPRRATPAVFALHAAINVAEAWLAGRDPALAATVAYLHTGAFAGSVISSFWSLMNERFDPHSARRVFGVIGTGATAGGVLGGLLVWRGAAFASYPVMLLLLGTVNAGCAIAVYAIGRPVVAARPAAKGSGRRAVRDSLGAGLSMNGYLVQLAALVASAALADALIEFAFKSEAASLFPGNDRLLPFFSLFHTCVALATFGVQAGLARRLLTRLGLSGTASVLPITIVTTAGVAAFAPHLWMVALCRAGTFSVEHSLFRSAYELAFTAIPAQRKRLLKPFMDVAVGRAAAAVAGVIALLLVAWVPAGERLRICMAVVALAGAAGWWLSRRLKSGYRAALAESLTNGSVALADDDIMDADTRHSFGGSLTLNRQAILARVQELMDRSPAAGEGSAPAGRPDPVDPWASVRGQLRSQNPARVRPTLKTLENLPRDLLPDVVALLGQEPFVSDAMAVLRGAADRHTGALIDAMLDPEAPAEIRRRIARVLAKASSRRAVDGLQEALSDSRFDVRFWAGAALLQLHLRRPEIPVDRAGILGAVERELSRSDAAVAPGSDPGMHPGHDPGHNQTHSSESDSGDGDDVPLLDQGSRARIGAAVSHVFNLLALVFEPEPLRLAFAAVASDDLRLQGTGIEYLDLVLPETIRQRLMPLLKTGAGNRPRRPQRMVLDELLASRDSLVLPPEVLRELRRSRD